MPRLSPMPATAPEAAGMIHTDFQRCFLEAEVFSFDQLVNTGSFSAANAAGKLRVEDNGYRMKYCDVLEFRFNK